MRFLEYDVRFPADSFSFCGGLDLESVPRTFFKLRDSHVKDRTRVGAPSGGGPPAVCAGQMVPTPFRPFRPGRQTLSAGFSFGAQIEECRKKPGRYSVRYRRMRIVDSGGRVYWNFYPASGTLPLLAPSALYDVTLTAPVLAGVLIQPDSYYVGPREKLVLDVTVRQFRSGQTPADHRRGQSEERTDDDSGLQGHGFRPWPRRNEDDRREDRQASGAWELSSGSQFRMGHETFSSRSEVISVRNHGLSRCLRRGSCARPGAMAWGADLVRFPNLPAYAHLRERGANFVNLFVSWSQVETRPGDYDFSMLDKMVAYAAQPCGPLVFINQDTDYPQWYRNECMFNQTGSVFARRGRELSFWAHAGPPGFSENGQGRGRAACEPTRSLPHTAAIPAAAWATAFIIGIVRPAAACTSTIIHNTRRPGSANTCAMFSTCRWNRHRAAMDSRLPHGTI